MELLDGIAAGWPAEVEGALRLVCTRGPEGGGLPSVYATLAEVPAAAKRLRRAGVTVATLPLGVPATGRPELPWLPVGIKSISYATNSAARRWAARNGVDDVLWVSTDGYVLEAPGANVVWLRRRHPVHRPARAYRHSARHHLRLAARPRRRAGPGAGRTDGHPGRAARRRPESG